MKNGDETFWTIDELGERVAEALGGPGYNGVPSGRVRDVPDLRTIRYYTTLFRSQGGAGDQNSDSPGPVLGHHALFYEDVSCESRSRAQAMAALISFIVFVGR